MGFSFKQHPTSKMMKKIAPSKPNEPSKPNKDLILQGFVVCISGFDEKERMNLCKLAVHLGAQVEAAISPRASCLIARYAGAPYCEEAINMSIPIVQDKYLKEVRAKAQLLPMEAFLLPVLYGLHISCTGMPSEYRHRAKSMVTELGGSWSGHLEHSKSTHLIALTPDAGDKYTHAKDWGIHIVLPRWLDECRKRKCWLPEKSFAVLEAAPSMDMDVEQMPQQLSQVQEMVADSQTEAEQTIADESTPHTVLGKRKAAALPWEVQAEQHLLTTAVTAWPDPAHTPLKKLLSRQRVFITGYPHEVQQYLCRCVLRLGGHVTPVVTQSTSYVALGPSTADQLRRQIAQHPCDVEQVNLVWFLETCFPKDEWMHLLEAWQQQSQ